jgi:hypothetical protein
MANRTSFKKGQVANPKGKAKGTFSEHKKKFIEIQKLAANDASEIYQKLKEHIEAGESWAYQIYWKELYMVPKNHNEETIEVKLPEEISKQGTEEYLKTFIESLSRFESFTKDEINSIIKTLSNAKLAEAMKNMIAANQNMNFTSYLDDGELKEVVLLYEKAQERAKTMTAAEWYNKQKSSI